MSNIKFNSITADNLHFSQVNTQTITASWLKSSSCGLHVLRLDKLHPVISGNKWFKLQYYLQQATQYSARKIATFGGAYSNHIVATAFACYLRQIPCAGFIRGEAAQTLSHTLLQAKAYGMELHFVSREAYKNKVAIQESNPDYYWVNEGGYGLPGAQGAATIPDLVPDIENYTHIIAAVGTGTMLAGLCKAAPPHQQIIGISAMKNNTALQQQVQALLDTPDNRFTILHDYHFGGYGKHPATLISYIQQCWQQYQLPLDIVYTGKAFFATEHLIKTHTIPQGSNVLFIHSGGLQGNLSLPAGTLPFS
ncbi:1-aminocyclopropane-1-carboxylate deaminase/D-cysteine desulfhydrase-like pyridoxal-dependent ACC family enzyme [Filimonas zeae]|uniref:1-aminocyclopropane-1-carboxylate deaminase/D-cysteine desulfhydrase n=1 Tax=Filimonas zeae TaxID=1737353 RepID=UPI00166E15AF|nr:pyridoxal-phosphate dependent enzyme [Filimonas zeae]MDR6342824.1 1-aminocyclopropane-1-carboxylate deaminase/D-cysteine desulfhydrase-like pyridoxal-dependent ACC family enzyme [Filimonas zeae]